MTGWPRGRSRDGGIDQIPLPGVPGALWLCGKHLVGPDPEADLARVSATSILCLCQDHELVDRYPGYVDWLDTNPAPRGRRFPTPDLGVRPLEDFAHLIDETVAGLRAGDRLVAHCAAGIGRSGTFAAGVLLALGHGHDQAIEVVAANRPMAGPEVGAQARIIEDLAQRLGAEPPGARP